MLNSLNLMMVISLVIIAICLFIIILKFNNYFNSKKQMMNDQRNNTQNIEILEGKLAEVKLKNKGNSLDENIKFIYNDENVFFSMEWGNIIE